MAPTSARSPRARQLGLVWVIASSVFFGGASSLAAPKPADKSGSADKAGSKSADKPGSKSADKPGSKPADKPGSKSADKPGSKPADKPGSKPADKPGSKPADKPGSKSADKPSPPVPAPVPAPAPAPTPAAAGYWLGAHLLGPGQAVLAALEDMSLGTSVDGAPAGASAIVGQVAALHDALRFVARWAFAAQVPGPSERALREIPAPLPGGDLWPKRGVVLAALTVQGRSEGGGVRTIQWPKDRALLLPPELQWTAAALLPERAPLFAAPAPRVPPAAERFALVRRAGDLFVLGALDRCEGQAPRECLRWVQVVVRDGDRFLAGYLPAYQVALTDAWQRGQGALPRAQVLASGARGDLARLLLVARARDNAIHRLTLEAPLKDGAYPEVRLRIEGDWAVLEIGDEPARRIALDASMDARPR